MGQSAACAETYDRAMEQHRRSSVKEVVPVRFTPVHLFLGAQSSLFIGPVDGVQTGTALLTSGKNLYLWYRSASIQIEIRSTIYLF